MISRGSVARRDDAYRDLNSELMPDFLTDVGVGGC